MASNYTEHYGLCQWEATDQVLREEFNEDNVKVDEALQAFLQKVTAVETAAAGFGNCQIYLSSYIGTGECGKDYASDFIFPVTPIVAVIVHQSPDGTSGGPCGILPCRGNMITNNGSCSATWSSDGKEVSWYSNLGTPASQLNMKDYTYLVYIFATAK